MALLDEDELTNENIRGFITAYVKSHHVKEMNPRTVANISDAFFDKYPQFISCHARTRIEQDCKQMYKKHDDDVDYKYHPQR